ncbi:c-type cytochrome [Tepidicaulis sp. LMO-SS28]|uniref:c-type cytochrome n=1 Tax=Tepidicaulis sp. LMO-SS28 TaxID=3447455 RepID=UPI003EE17926
MKRISMAILAAAAMAASTAAHAEGDVAKGEKIFKRCAMCHTLEEGAGNRIGPNLWGMFSRPVASVEDFRYSQAMQEKAGEIGTWDEESLDAYLTRPRDYVPGTNMAFAGLRKESDRTNLIAYLKEATGAE